LRIDLLFGERENFLDLILKDAKVAEQHQGELNKRINILENDAKRQEKLISKLLHQRDGLVQENTRRTTRNS
jgi:hypothetical protein